MARRVPGEAAAARLDAADPRVRMDAAWDLLRAVLADAPPASVDAAASLIVPGLVALAERFRPSFDPKPEER
jgi:hypothetical protein